MLEQDTNAYAILPSSQWRGYSEPPEAAAAAVAAHGAITRAACAMPSTEAGCRAARRRQPARRLSGSLRTIPATCWQGSGDGSAGRFRGTQNG